MQDHTIYIHIFLIDVLKNKWFYYWLYIQSFTVLVKRSQYILQEMRIINCKWEVCLMTHLINIIVMIVLPMLHYIIQSLILVWKSQTVSNYII